MVVRLSLGDLDYLKFIKEQGLHFFFYNKNFRSYVFFINYLILFVKNFF